MTWQDAIKAAVEQMTTEELYNGLDSEIARRIDNNAATIYANAVKKQSIKDFCLAVHAKALDLMEHDNKVEGKHYAAMKLVLNELGIEIPEGMN